MNQIQSIQRLNEHELSNNVPTSASWHQDFRDTAFVFFGGLSYSLNEGDILVIFSQFGVPVYLKLARDKESGKSRGFGWLKYEDQRSTILAVDNLNGSKILGRVIHVDHAFYEEKEKDYDEEYEKLLLEAMANDMATDADANANANANANDTNDTTNDNDFTDPLLLMNKQMS